MSNGKGPNSGIRPATDPVATISTSNLTPLTLTLWHSWSGRKAQALNSLARAFEQQHPNLRIVLESHPSATLVRDYTSQVADGSAPQLILTRGRYIGDLASHHQILPLDDVTSKQLRLTLVPAALASTESGGVNYGLPLTMDFLAFWYDRRTFRELPSSIAAVTQSPDPVKVSDVQPIKLAYHLSLITTLPYLYVLGGRLRTLDDALAMGGAERTSAVRWLTGLQSLLIQPTVKASDDPSIVDQALQVGHASAAVDWSYQWPEYETAWGRDAIGVATLRPTAEGGQQPPTVVSSEVLSINVRTTEAQRAASWDLLRFLGGDIAQANLAHDADIVPTNTRASVEGPVASLRAAFGEAVPEPSMFDAHTWAVLNDMVNNVLIGNAGPDQALDAAVAQLRRPAP
ncbi:MAG: extracellular solute-binding protein [Herpetosiphon sp.]